MVVKLTPPATAVLDAFVAVAHRVVWATVATVDGRGRPRSRVMHPIWQRPADGADDGLVGWVFTRPTPLKLAHLSGAPYVSCAYHDTTTYDVAVAECDAVLVDDPDVRRAVWDLFANGPEPVGYDPRILGAADPSDPAITVLRMDPWRLSTSSALPTVPRLSWQRG
jgi:hypothetical protein